MNTKTTERLVISSILLVGGCLAGAPQYNVYSARLNGEAQLAEAESSRQIAVREAMAARDSAELKAEAEIIRARGVAEANKIVSEGLGGLEGYLRYLYINNLENTKNQIIYIPTEAGLPILEAGKRED
jgi:regulator of protease activity HflC (stomatin/prohibitin superfamily)